MQYPMNLIIVYICQVHHSDTDPMQSHCRHCRWLGCGDCISDSGSSRLQVRSVLFATNKKYVSSTQFGNSVLRYNVVFLYGSDDSNFQKTVITKLQDDNFRKWMFTAFSQKTVVNLRLDSLDLQSASLPAATDFQSACKTKWFICDWIYSPQVYQRRLVSSLLINGSK